VFFFLRWTWGDLRPLSFTWLFETTEFDKREATNSTLETKFLRVVFHGFSVVECHS
jgi:hypothetical protein